MRTLHKKIEDLHDALRKANINCYILPRICGGDEKLEVVFINSGKVVYIDIYSYNSRLTFNTTEAYKTICKAYMSGVDISIYNYKEKKESWLDKLKNKLGGKLWL